MFHFPLKNLRHFLVNKTLSLKRLLNWKLVLALIFLGLVSGGVFVFLPQPRVVWTFPSDNHVLVGNTASPVRVFFDRPINTRFLESAIFPGVQGQWGYKPFLFGRFFSRELQFYPSVSFFPGETFLVSLEGITDFLGISKKGEYKFTFKSMSPPKVTLVSPSNGESKVALDAEIKVSLSEKDNLLAEWQFSFSPEIKFQAEEDFDQRAYTLKPKEKLKEGTNYIFKVYQIPVSYDLASGEVAEKGNPKLLYEGSFTTVEIPEIKSFLPAGEEVSLDEIVKIEFDSKMDKISVEERFGITPEVKGEFQWEEERIFIFKPKSLNPATLYTINLKKGAKNEDGEDLKEDFSFSFKTKEPVREEKVYPTEEPTPTLQTIISPKVEETFSLSLPWYKQEHLFTCAIAATRMALAYRGIYLSEADILNMVGFDSTPFDADKNIWGNPNEAFVGNIDGNPRGYGVHWEPIARVIQNYRPVSVKTGWNLTDLLKEVKKGNPVLIWWQNGWHEPIDYSWYTKDGEYIYAIQGQHVELVKGFIGSPENPSVIFTLDPWRKERSHQRDYFENWWRSYYNNTAVVVY